jgi:hypothetical protein
MKVLDRRQATHAYPEITMITKSFVPGIFLDNSLAVDRSDITEQSWRDGIEYILSCLYSYQPCTTSRSVLHAISRSGRTVTIMPEKQSRFSSGRITPNATTTPTDDTAASAAGKQSEQGSIGVGGGSDVIITFNSQDFESPSSSKSLDAADEVLLHELVHAVRQVKGFEDNAPLVAPIEILRRGEGAETAQRLGTTSPPHKYTQIYHNIEEFCAILITNIYRSENGRPGLIRDHYGRGPKELAWPLTNARNFLTVWRPQISRIFGEMNDVCRPVAEVQCHFNPFGEFARLR